MKRTFLAALFGMTIIVVPATDGKLRGPHTRFRASAEAQSMPTGSAHPVSRAERMRGLRYHRGGSVMVGPRKSYLVYVGSQATFPDSRYQALISQFLTDVSAPAPSRSNVYSNLSEYYQAVKGVRQGIQNVQSLAGNWWDESMPTSSGCTSTTGGSLACLSDAQIQQELLKAIATNGWPEGLQSQYFVVLGNGITTCLGARCFDVSLCSFHGWFQDPATGSDIVYAAIPYMGSAPDCQVSQSPNGEVGADSAINVMSHESLEMITDPLFNAWYDRSENEMADRCAWTFGKPLGTTTSGQYNQIINGHEYYLQREWSDRANRCVLR